MQAGGIDLGLDISSKLQTVEFNIPTQQSSQRGQELPGISLLHNMLNNHPRCRGLVIPDDHIPGRAVLRKIISVRSLQ